MKLNKLKIISKKELINLAESKYNEANALLASANYTGAMYLGGYAIECILKAAICKAIKQEGLTSVFKSHDLNGLLYYTGSAGELEEQANLQILAAFNKIVGEWNDVEGNPRRRYEEDGAVKEVDARDFLFWIDEVRKWFLARI